MFHTLFAILGRVPVLLSLPSSPWRWASVLQQPSSASSKTFFSNPSPILTRSASCWCRSTTRSKTGPAVAQPIPGRSFLDYAAQNHSFDRVIASDSEDILYTQGEGT